MELETKRLLLRNYKTTDINDYWEYVSSDKVGPMCGWTKYTDLKSAEKRLELETKKPYQFAIVLKDNNKVIGSVELMDVKENINEHNPTNEIKEIGFLLSEKYWGKGIMPEAVLKIMEFAFLTLKVKKLYAGHYDANFQSARVQDKLGFKIIGHKNNEKTWIDGKKTVLIQRCMTREDFLEKFDINLNNK